MRFLAISSFIFLLPFFGFAQVSVSGVVLDREYKDPIPGAVVVVKEQQLQIPTNLKGKFTFNLNRDSVLLTISAIGFKPQNLRLLRPTQDTLLQIYLSGLSDNLNVLVVEEEQFDQTFGKGYLNSVEGTRIFEGKKTEVILVDEVVANKSGNIARQLFAKVVGLNIWESDCAGLQLGVGGRGLSPNRSANFNTRQNGYDMSADALGYPESYYSPAFQALERVEVVRGASSLQYGTQFGGVINFELKSGPTDKRWSWESRNTYNSLGYFNTFNSTGGQVNQTNYYAYNRFVAGDCYRCNSEFDASTSYVSIKQKLRADEELKLDYTNYYYLAQQPGGLTTSQFEQDPTQSVRERNWFRVNWNLLGLTYTRKFSSQSTLSAQLFGLIAGRDALGNLQRIDRPDAEGSQRDYLYDRFRNIGAELRYLNRYTLLKKPAVLAMGIRGYHGYTDRRQGLGNGETGPDFNFLNAADNLEGSNFDFYGRNLSAFAEQIVDLTDRWSITTGVRAEYIQTIAEGYYQETSFTPGSFEPSYTRIEESKSLPRSFLLFGAGTAYRFTNAFEAYGNVAQNYRAVTFNDIRVVNPNLRVDENLEDERGYTSTVGLRGSVNKVFNLDFSGFLLNYKNRIGTVQRTERDPRVPDLDIELIFRERTNTGDALIYGVEGYVDTNVLRLLGLRPKSLEAVAFTNFAIVGSRYTRSIAADIEGNRVELTPKYNYKLGLNILRKTLGLSFQYSYVSFQYSEATNSLAETPNAIEGPIPSYSVVDLNAEWKLNRLIIELGINNALDNQYFTRRATGYPGPGILPSDGRNAYLTLGWRI